jgi:hypothetical protein
MKERPILFNGSMIRAILSGKKTVTRRALTKSRHPEEIFPCDYSKEEAMVELGSTRLGTRWWKSCPYGKPGDRLWVRETWAEVSVTQAPDQKWIVYRECDNRTDFGGPWKPSIFMPRRASRILLEVTDVRVERLHAITNQQCIAEGCSGGRGSIPRYIGNATVQEHFRHIWESTGGDYHANPWVWVVEFKQVVP